MIRFIFIKHRLLLLGFVFYITCFTAYPQLTVNESATNAQMVDLLTGGTLTVSNISYKGSADQSGTFTTAGATTTELGFTEGVLLTTARASLISGTASGNLNYNAGGNATDQDLGTLIGITDYGNETNDANALEFDFVASSDKVQFRYVFGSDEYKNYVCSAFNDSFGFFLSGPGISGGVGLSNDAINLATLPGSSIPVSINTVNDGVADFSASNCSALDPSWTSNTIHYRDNSSSATIEFYGTTVILTAEADVVSGQTYHIKLAVCDVGFWNTDFDSGVFLEAGSFISVPTTPSTTIDFDGANDYINRSSLLAGNDEVSMMSWVKLDTGFDGGDIMGEGNYRLYVDSSNRLKSSIKTASVGTPVSYTINMFDSYSDGWNTSGDGYIDISVGGVPVAGSPFEPANGVSPDTATFTVNVGDVVDIEFRSDNYPGEMSFNIYNNDDSVQAFPSSGNQSHSSSGNTIDSFSFTALCSSCTGGSGTIASLKTPDADAPTLLTDVWYHVATIYNGSSGEIKTYLNGELQWMGTGIGATIETSSDDFEIGRKADTQSNYFEGAIYESRVYDVELTENQLREQIYQAVQNNGGKVHGVVIPKDIDGGSLNWSNLVSYYKMDTVVASDTTDDSLSGIPGNLNNMTTTQERTAPLPYVANSSGDWTSTATWEYGSVWDIESLPNKDWAIVQVTNNAKVTTVSSHTHLGLLIDSGSELEIQNDQLLQNTNYIRLDGQIDLVGESQFIQTSSSDLDVASAGYLERDQDGKSNRYQYNYWSSPVSPINTSLNNTNYTVAGVLKDGTTPSNPQDINFIGGYDGVPGSPISLAEFWIFKFINSPDEYENWTQPQSSGLFEVGQGFTLKGSGAGTVTQNYTFSGKPNNGVIQHPIGADNMSLLGNPYPSALDAHAFINDNIGVNASSTGALYFWEHWGGNSHVLAQYEGGYATLNLTGYTMAISDPMVSSNGSGTLVPKRYLPVGQGFMIYGDSDGGTIEFNNTQRIFEKESSGNSTFIRSANQNVSTQNVSVNSIDRVYFNFVTPEGPVRELLLGVKEGLTKGIDYGYDAKRFNKHHTDCGWKIEEEPYVIQGIGDVYQDLELPLMINIGTTGTCQFMIGDLTELDSSVEVYFRDAELQIEERLRSNESVSFTLSAGDYNNRFSVVFKRVITPESLDDDEFVQDDLVVFYNSQQAVLNISNSTFFNGSDIKLYNLLGQEVFRSIRDYSNIKTIDLPLQVATGTYLVQFNYNGKKLTKKILVN